jgi:hypothetical protein
LIALALFAATLGLALTGTTAANATVYTYDASTIERVDVRAGGGAAAGSAGLSDVGEVSASPSATAQGASTTLVSRSVATKAADDAARFVVDSAGNTTLRAQGPSGWIDVTSHAARRMTQRGISIDDVDQALTQTPFNYWHSNTWKVGYYDPGTNVFVGTVNGVATTVITPSAGPQYVANLLAAAP